MILKEPDAKHQNEHGAWFHLYEVQNQENIDLDIKIMVNLRCSNH